MNNILKGLLTTALLTSSILTNASSDIFRQDAAYIKSDYAKTKYPVVLSHGLFGFSRLGADTFGVDYWYQIPQDLARNGANVFITRQSAANSSEVRGEQLLAQTEEILAITGQPKVNLLGHSHGSQSIRYVAGIIPNHIASVTTIAGPAKGSPVADLVINSLTPLGLDKTVANIISAATNIITIGQLDDPKEFPMDSLSAAHSLSSIGTAKFNARFPAGVPNTHCGEGAYDVNGTKFFSFSGSKPITNLVDPVDYVLGLTSVFIKEKNDGLVSSCSSRIGKVIRDDYYWNHLDEVNQLLGLMSLFSQDPVSVYRQHLNRLKLAGV